MDIVIRVVGAVAIVVGGWVIWAPTAFPRLGGLLLAVAGSLILAWEVWTYGVRRRWFPEPKMSLHDATRKAYEKTQSGSAAAFAERTARDTNGTVHSWYAIAFTNSCGAKVFGKKLPSTILVEIPRDEVKRCQFADEARSLTRHGEKSPTYSDLRITRADYRRCVADIKTWKV